ncbi:MAG: hypothetical protein C5B58_07880 [Acidobacteria bacterium]|nr:MAG: hypothetical protein C5B58_07880 [Acidobacteriota bacterium]
MFFMGNFTLAGKRRLRPCLATLRVLASSNNPHRQRLIEREIDKYLQRDPLGFARGLERLRVAIHDEEAKLREGEDWSVAQDYVRQLLHGMTSS